MLGMAFIVVGIVFLGYAIAAQGEIDGIGATNDPALQERISVLEDERDTLTLTGVSAMFVGMFAWFVMSGRSLQQTIPDTQMMSSAALSNDITKGMFLKGNAAYLPAHRGLSKERVFVPAPKGDLKPPTVLSDDLFFHLGRDGTTPGLVAEPLGRDLLDRLEADLGTKLGGASLDAVEGNLQVLKHGLGMMRDFHFKERGDKTMLRVEYSGLLEACRRVRKERPSTCSQLACVGCSCLLTAAARATGKMVVVEGVDNSEDQVLFLLSLVDW
jgi:hypothetical protein